MAYHEPLGDSPSNWVGGSTTTANAPESDSLIPIYFQDLPGQNCDANGENCKDLVVGQTFYGDYSAGVWFMCEGGCVYYDAETNEYFFAPAGEI